MSAGGRARTRERLLRRAALIAGVLVLLALVLLFSGHWVLGIIIGIAAVVAVWVFLQARSVR
jgi:low affinity Fe/Cu permease